MKSPCPLSTAHTLTATPELTRQTSFQCSQAHRRGPSPWPLGPRHLAL